MAEGKRPFIPDYTIRDAKIRWRNFGGRAERFNQLGDRNFTIFLTPEDSERLTEMGLNVKTLPPRPDAEEGTPLQDILKVKVKFVNRMGQPLARPPQLVLVTHRGRTTLGPDEAQMLDFAPIKKVDLILSPYVWDAEDGSGRGGVAVTVKKLFLTMVEDELEMEYGDLPEASSAARSLEYTPFDGDEDED